MFIRPEFCYKARLNKKTACGVLIAFSTSVIFGFCSALIRKILVSDIVPSVALFARLFYAACFTMLVAYALKARSKKSEFEEVPLRYILLLATGRAGASYFLFVGFSIMTAAVAMALHKVSIIFILLFSVVLRPSSLRNINWPKVVLGLSAMSVSVALFAESKISGIPVITLVGVAVMLVASAFWAIYSVGQQHLKNTDTGTTPLWHRMIAIGHIQAAATLLILPVACFSQTGISPMFSEDLLLPLALLGLLSGVVTIMAFEGLKRIGAFLFSMIITLEVPLTMAFESAWLDVQFPAQVMVGTMLIVLATLLVLGESRKLL